ncbi:MAG TPA: hypothetical protein VGI28_03335 [Stellaceae bacterium]
MVLDPEDRRGWGAILFPPGVSGIFGAVRGSARLHWTQDAPREEAEDWIAEMGDGPISWETIEQDHLVVGRCRTYVVTLHSVLLSRGEPPS